MQNRRTFLTTLGAAAIGIANGCRPATASAGIAPRRKLSRIGLQLYTVRDRMQADLPGTLAQVAAAGYKEVEFAGYFGRSPAQIRELLQRNGLTSPSTHVQSSPSSPNWQKTLADAKAIGHEWAIIPWIPEEARRDLDGWRRILDQLNTGARQARDAGLKFGYHNHDFEFQRFGNVVPFDMMLEGTDPALVDFEMDLYWVTKAGSNPLDYFRRFPGRFPLVHVKDSMGKPDDRMVEVGKGSIDFAAIFAASGLGGIQHYFVEHDNPADPIASIRSSFNYLKNLEY